MSIQSTLKKRKRTEEKCHISLTPDEKMQFGNDVPHWDSVLGPEIDTFLSFNKDVLKIWISKDCDNLPVNELAWTVLTDLLGNALESHPQFADLKDDYYSWIKRINGPINGSVLLIFDADSQNLYSALLKQL